MGKRNYYNLMAENGYYSKPERLKFYLEKQLFKGIDFKNKSIIDIGGGNGLFGYYAAINGASKVVVMEPEFNGSSAGMIREFGDINKLLGNLGNITHTTKILEDYERANNQFDYILMHNSINHIDEEACIVLRDDNEAQQKYLKFFKLLEEISNAGTVLLVHDCTSKNFFNDLGMKSPFAKSIEWEKHQHPKVWAKYLEEAGFTTQSIQWTTFNALKAFGRIIMGNRFISYFTHSAFLLKMKKV